MKKWWKNSDFENSCFYVYLRFSETFSRLTMKNEKITVVFPPPKQIVIVTKNLKKPQIHLENDLSSVSKVADYEFEVKKLLRVGKLINFLIFHSKAKVSAAISFEVLRNKYKQF